MLNYDDIVSNLMQELRRGTLIIVVLSQYKKEEGRYNLITKLKENGITVETNTLYPLLRRLENQGLLKSEWNTKEDKPRKYYLITEYGKEVLKKSINHWKEFSYSVNKIIDE
uniref:PadR family transcriptional regulator n=1 Tax=Brachyspira innocens TaxID=13264 RepID=UPI0026F19FC2